MDGRITLWDRTGEPAGLQIETCADVSSSETDSLLLEIVNKQTGRIDGKVKITKKDILRAIEVLFSEG